MDREGNPRHDDRDSSDPVENAEQRRVQLYTRGLNKTLGTPHRRYVRRLAIQRALREYRETVQPEDR